jgi:hypothetical protein
LIPWWCNLKIPKEFVIPMRAALLREESAVSTPAENRFLTDKAGFGMTRVRGLRLRKLR